MKNFRVAGFAGPLALLEEGINGFNLARVKAKISGKLLACALALRVPFKTQTVTLIGHSLGSQVIKSCLKTLDDIYEKPTGHPSETIPCDIIQNVVMLAGATHFHNHKSTFNERRMRDHTQARRDAAKEKYHRLFTNIVNGEAFNVYSKSDSVLLCLFTTTQWVLNPLGRNNLTIFDNEVLASEEHIRHGKDIIRNYDATNHDGKGDFGHTDYCGKDSA